MANMFSGNIEKKVPKSLKECYGTDAITHNLWVWCERVEKLGTIICAILISIGLLSTISVAFNTAELVDRLRTLEPADRELVYATLGGEPSVFSAIVQNLASWALYSFLAYCAYHVIALLIGSLATIVQNSKITANIALYQSAKAENMVNDVEDKETAGENNSKIPNISFKKVYNVKYNQDGSYICPQCKMSNDSKKICERCGFNPNE